jgi:hypothetical protein
MRTCRFGYEPLERVTNLLIMPFMRAAERERKPIPLSKIFAVNVHRGLAADR